MADPLTIDFKAVANELSLKPDQVANTVELLDADNTVPFITRYRKERTGNLDEEQIRAIQDRVHSLRQIKERASTILRLIDAQQKLTPKLKSAIESATSLKILEDLYLPYRPKKRSRATIARERGLSPLAKQIWEGDTSLGDLDQAAQALVDSEKKLESVGDVLHGVSDILAENVSENADVRARCRRIAYKTGALSVSATKQGKDSGQEFRDYFDYSEEIQKIPPHRALAVNRGVKNGALKVRFQWDHERATTEVLIFLRLTVHPYSEFLKEMIADAVTRLIQPSLERELRRELTERAEAHAVSVFARNLKNLLLQPPLAGKRLLAIDPGFRTGCKIAVLDEMGNCILNDVVYVTGPAEKRAATRQKLADLLKEHNCQTIAIGNGTACRETEELISETIEEHSPETRYLIVNESGASVYSTSPLAREEFPDLDSTVRGTISIGRRLLDPLSELVKIDPQHIGVGMYQHDVSNKELKESLDTVIESCVNYVGVDLNSSSASLLRHVSGLNQLIARRVVEWRQENGRFTSRQQLMDVQGIGESTFTQAAGFLKIHDGNEPLDGTWIHPESYQLAHDLLNRLSVTPKELTSSGSELREKLGGLDTKALSSELNVGLPTLNDIVENLSRPGRDPRADSAGPVFKKGILKLNDLHEGMELTGTILNVVDFGAFVDIGLKDSGLVHVSKLSGKYIKSPHEVVSVGDVVTAWVLGIDRERRRVSLTMIPPNSDSTAAN